MAQDILKAFEADALVELSAHPDASRQAMATSIEAAAAELSAAIDPGENFGGISPLWQKAKEQLYLFICTDDPKYKGLRKQASDAGAVAKELGIPMTAAAIAGTAGLDVALATPFVALAIIGVLQIGKNSWCAAFADGQISFGDNKVDVSLLHEPQNAVEGECKQTDP